MISSLGFGLASHLSTNPLSSNRPLEEVRLHLTHGRPPLEDVSRERQISDPAVERVHAGRRRERRPVEDGDLMEHAPQVHLPRGGARGGESVARGSDERLEASEMSREAESSVIRPEFGVGGVRLAALADRDELRGLPALEGGVDVLGLGEEHGGCVEVGVGGGGAVVVARGTGESHDDVGDGGGLRDDASVGEEEERRARRERKKSKKRRRDERGDERARGDERVRDDVLRGLL